MRLIDADAIRWIDLNSDIPHSKTSAIRVYIAFKDEIDRMPTIDIEERLDDAYAHGWSDAEAKFHDAVEVKRGEWIIKQKGFGIEAKICSVCGVEKNNASNFCPNCGARMDGGQDEVD